jgi:TonB family protein
MWNFALTRETSYRSYYFWWHPARMASSASDDGTTGETEALSAPVAKADLRTPNLPWMADRLPGNRAHTLLACLTAVGLHGGIAAGLWFGGPLGIEDIGGDGLGRDAIGIDLIDTKVLAALRPDVSTSVGASNSLATNEGVATPEVARIETIDAAAAKPDPASATIKPDMVLPDFEERPEPPTPDVLTIAKQTPEIDPPPTAKDDKPTPKPDASPATTQVASRPNPEAVEAVQGGSTSQSATVVPETGSAAAKAASGRSKAYGQSVMAALVTTQPKPRLGLGTGTSGWLTGTVVIDFTLGLDGGIEEAHIATSSGHRTLDQAALDAVLRTRFPKPPADLRSNERQYIMPYYFR